MEVHVCAQTGPGAIRRCLRGTTSVSAAICRRMAKWDKCARGVGRKAFVRRRGKPWSYLQSTVCNVSRMAASYLCEPLQTDLATTHCASAWSALCWCASVPPVYLGVGGGRNGPHIEWTPVSFSLFDRQYL